MIHSSLLPASETKNIQLEAFVTSEAGKAAVELLFEKVGSLSSSSFHSGTLATVARMLGVANFGEVVIAELGQEPLADTIETVREIACEGVQLILLGQHDDVATYRSLIAAGAMDYLALPLSDDVEFPNLGATRSSAAPPAIERAGKVIAVCGVSGGVGASTLSANLAVALLKEANSDGYDTPLADVSLIDADLGFGSLAIDFDIEQTHGLIDALSAPERIDRTFLTATMAEPIAGLRIYSAEDSQPLQIPQHEEGLFELSQHLRRECPVTVFDLPRKLLAENTRLLDDVDDVILVMSPGFSSVRHSGRLTEQIKNRETPPRLWHVLSRTRRDAGLKSSEINSALAHPIDFEIPQCASDLARASVKGQPLQKLAARSSYARTISKLAKRIVAPTTPAKATRRNIFGRSGN